jgi:hypothetical protein
MEYIEREAAIKIVEKYGLTNGFAWGRNTGLAICIASEIADIPAADVAPVVRCEDCVHWDDDPDTYGADDGPKGKCMKSFETMCADDFCSFGERKENNDEKV